MIQATRRPRTLNNRGYRAIANWPWGEGVNQGPKFGALGYDPDTAIMVFSGNGIITFSGAI